MTIIACAGNIMVADGAVFRGQIRYPSPYKKIIRAPDGSLCGACGPSQQIDAWRYWVEAGMNFSELPRLPEAEEKDNQIDWLWLRPDEKLLRGNHNFDTYEVSNPNCIGDLAACTFWEGANWATGNPQFALLVSLEHCVWIGGEPQMEVL